MVIFCNYEHSSVLTSLIALKKKKKQLDRQLSDILIILCNSNQASPLSAQKLAQKDSNG